MNGPKNGYCCICGRNGPLTFEHVPPKKAFNNEGLLVASVQDYLDAGEDKSKVRQRESRKGFGKYSLCEKCNNLTGAWYGTKYIDWAYQGTRFMGNSGSIAVPFHIFPGSIAKQVIAMFATINGSGFFRRHPELTRYVLDKDATGLPSKFRLFCYFTSRNAQSYRASGITAVMKLGSGGPSIFSEMSFVPFGYVLSIDSPPPEEGLFDISFFFDHKAGAYRDVHLPIPTRETHSYFPADYRTEKEWAKATSRGNKDLGAESGHA